MDTITLRALKGAPLSTLIALTILHHAGPLAIAELTGYDRKTTATALRALGRMGLAESTGRYDGYQLTTTCQQLPLWTPPQLRDIAHTEGENLPLPLCSSSSSINPPERVQKQLPPPPGEGNNLPLPSTTARSTGRWLAACTGINENTATAKFQELEAAGATWPEYELKARRWLTFALQHDTIKHKGAYILSRLSQPPPRDTPHDGRAEYIRHLQAQCKEDPYA